MVPSDSAYGEGAHLSFEDISVDCIENPQVLKSENQSFQDWPISHGGWCICGADKLQLLPSGRCAGIHGNERAQARSTVYIQWQEATHTGKIRSQS